MHTSMQEAMKHASLVRDRDIMLKGRLGCRQDPESAE